MINNVIGKYKILRLIGEGGMSTVYEAEHEILGTRAAIKILHSNLSNSNQITERFKKEAKIMASLDHPNIIKVIDFDDQPNQLSIIMELLSGEDLNKKIKKQGTLSRDEVIQIFSQALEALEHAHGKGYVHRDIKPSNLYVLPSGQVKILDFGIAKICGKDSDFTQTGTQIGTPVYMSPEQVKADKALDQRSDIYSLGVTLYYALQGVPPYNSEDTSQFEIFSKIVYEPLPPLLKFPEFSEIIAKACHKNKDQRFQTCAEWTSALMSFKNETFQSTIRDRTISVENSDVTKSNSVVNQSANTSSLNHGKIPEVILMPMLSDTMTEGVIARWHKKIGDQVKKGDLLADVETDKATMELESYNEGHLLYIGAQVNENIAVGSIMCIIGDPEKLDVEAILQAKKYTTVQQTSYDTLKWGETRISTLPKLSADTSIDNRTSTSKGVDTQIAEEVSKNKKLIITIGGILFFIIFLFSYFNNDNEETILVESPYSEELLPAATSPASVSETEMVGSDEVPADTTAAAPAHDFNYKTVKIKNTSEYKLDFCFAYYDGKGFHSEGWFPVEKNSVLTYMLPANYTTSRFYYYVEVDDTRKRPKIIGDERFCIDKSHKFNFSPQDKCSGVYADFFLLNLSAEETTYIFDKKSYKLYKSHKKKIFPAHLPAQDRS